MKFTTVESRIDYAHERFCHLNVLNQNQCDYRYVAEMTVVSDVSVFSENS